MGILGFWHVGVWPNQCKDEVNFWGKSCRVTEQLDTLTHPYSE